MQCDMGCHLRRVMSYPCLTSDCGSGCALVEVDQSLFSHSFPIGLPCSTETILNNCVLSEAEVDAEVACILEHWEAEKHKGCPQHVQDIEEVRNRVTNLEVGLNRLGVIMTTLHNRLENMMRQLLGNQSQVQGATQEDDTDPSLLARRTQTLVETPRGGEAWNNVQRNFLNPIVGVEVLGAAATPAVSFVPIDDTEVMETDVTADAMDAQNDGVEDIVVGGTSEALNFLDIQGNLSKPASTEEVHDVDAPVGHERTRAASTEVEPSTISIPTEEVKRIQ